MVTLEQFLAYRDFKSAFGTADPALIESLLADGDRDCPGGVWGDRQNRAIFLLTAHRLRRYLNAIETSGFATGSITSLSASQESQTVSFASTDNDMDPEAYGSTIYGQEFKSLIRKLATIRGGAFVRI